VSRFYAVLLSFLSWKFFFFAVFGFLTMFQLHSSPPPPFSAFCSPYCLYYFIFRFLKLSLFFCSYFPFLCSSSIFFSSLCSPLSPYHFLSMKFYLLSCFSINKLSIVSLCVSVQLCFLLPDTSQFVGPPRLGVKDSQTQGCTNPRRQCD